MSNESKPNSEKARGAIARRTIMLRRYNRTLRAAAPLALAAALSLAIAAPAAADSVATEQQHGAQVLTQVHQGKLGPTSLTSDQYQNLGEYLMGKALGSTQLHQRMNTLMDQMMGASAADQMHIYLGKRYLGINATPGNRYGALYGLMGAMMSGYRGSSLAAMMSAYLSGQGASGYPTSAGMMGYGHGNTPAANAGAGWPTGAIIAVTILGVLLIGGALAFAFPRLRERPDRPAAKTG
jgi:hypothetical protein